MGRKSGNNKIRTRNNRHGERDMSDAAESRQDQFSGTKEVAESHKFDEKRLEDYMAAHVEGFQGPLTVKQFKGGQSNPTYQLVTPAKKYVLRRKPPGKLLPSAHAVDREIQGHHRASRRGFPGAAHLLSLRGRRRHRHHVLHHGHGRGPRALGAAAACPGQGNALEDLRLSQRHAGAASHHRLREDRPRRFRQAR